MRDLTTKLRSVSACQKLIALALFALPFVGLALSLAYLTYAATR